MKNKEVIKNVPSATKVAEWDSKETIEGAQAKADKALQDAKQYADDHKVEKIIGKQLSTEDFTSEEKTKLALLEPYTHPAKHRPEDIATNQSAKFVTDIQIKTWTNKESVEGAIAKDEETLQKSIAYTDKEITDIKINKFDSAEINPQRQLVFKANGVIKNTLQLPLGEGSSNYVLPPATTTLLGGVKIGQGLSSRSDGTISVNLSDIGAFDWSNISGKPLSFNPSQHTHTKIDITDMFNVVDNLTSVSTTDALSARQGKELKELIMSSTHQHLDVNALNSINSLKVAEWDNKETTIGAQDKATKALNDAKRYVEEKLALVPTMLYYKTSVKDWAQFDDLGTLFKATVVHNLNCTEIIVESFNEQNISEFTSYRVVNENAIELFSENKNTMRVTVLGLLRK